MSPGPQNPSPFLTVLSSPSHTTHSVASFRTSPKCNSVLYLAAGFCKEMLCNSPQVWHFIIYQLHLHCFYKPSCAPQLCTEPCLSFLCAGKIFHPALIGSGEATWCAISPAISESPTPFPLPNFRSCIGKERRIWMHPCWWKFLFVLQKLPNGF